MEAGGASIGEGDVKMKAVVRLMQPWVKKCAQPLEDGKCKKWILPQSLQKEHSSYDGLF